MQKKLSKYNSDSKNLIEILVLFPKLSEYLVKHNLIDIFPMEPIHFFETVTNMIISRRKEGLEVSIQEFIKNPDKIDFNSIM
jgi:hypothetical protein